MKNYTLDVNSGLTFDKVTIIKGLPTDITFIYRCNEETVGVSLTPKYRINLDYLDMDPPYKAPGLSIVYIITKNFTVSCSSKVLELKVLQMVKETIKQERPNLHNFFVQENGELFAYDEPITSEQATIGHYKDI